ncbi:MAG: helix-turn-helix transcriptional regulator [Thermoanaerobaculia bacterium]
MRPRETRQLPAEERRALGVRIVERRRAKRWSQREVARRTGIRYMRLSKLENGHATPSLAELLLIAESLDAGLEELVRGAPPVGSKVERYLLPPLLELEDLGAPEECAILGKLLRILVAGFKATRAQSPETHFTCREKERADANP